MAKSTLRTYVMKYLGNRDLVEFHLSPTAIGKKYTPDSFFKDSFGLCLKINIEKEILKGDFRIHPCIGLKNDQTIRYKKLQVTHKVKVSTLKELVCFVFSWQGKNTCTEVTFEEKQFYVWQHMLFFNGYEGAYSLFCCTKSEAGYGGVRIFVKNLENLSILLSPLKGIILKDLIPLVALYGGDVATEINNTTCKMIAPIKNIVNRELTLSLTDRLNIAKFIEYEKMG